MAARPLQAAKPGPPDSPADGAELAGPKIAERDDREGSTLDAEGAESRIEQLSARFEKASTERLATALLQGYDENDDAILNVAKNQLVARAKAGDGTATSAIVASLDRAEPGLQEYLVRVLGEIATADALRALIDIANRTLAIGDRAVRAATHAIAEVGQWRDESVPPEDLSALLEPYFRAISPRDTETLSAVAQGLTTLGTPQGVSEVLQMLDQLQQAGPSGKEARSRLSEALREVRNPASVPVLATRLQDDPGLTAETSRIAGDAMAAMGAPQATEALLNWAAGVTGAASTAQAVKWLSETREHRSLELLLEVNRRADFRDPALKERLAALARELSKRARPSSIP
jgi:hypothetical protein